MRELPAGVKFRNLPGFSRLFVDWIEGVPSARAFLPFRPELAALRERALELGRGSSCRAEIHRLLLSQAGIYNAGDLALKNIHRLLLPDSMVILTSLPAAVAGGPLSLLLKCLTTAKIAAELERNGVPAIPVCWLDPAAGGETALTSVALLDQEGRLQKLELGSAAASDSAGGSDWPVPEEIEACFTLLETSLGFDLKDPVLQELTKAFARGTPFRIASARFISAIVNEWGIVLLDPRTREFRDIALRVLAGSDFSLERATYLFCRRQKSLLEAGYYRPGSDLGGGAEALSKKQQADADVPMEVEDAAEGVSPGPYLQMFLEASLPVAGYVIDHREIHEFALAAALFEELGFHPPPVWPRASATILDARNRKIMEKYGIGLASLLARNSELLRDLARDGSQGEITSRFESLSSLIEKSLGEIARVYPPEDSLSELAADTRSRMLFQLEKLKERYMAAMTVRREVTGRQVQRILSSIAPEGNLQEDVIASLHFIRNNSSGFAHRLYDRLDIESFEHQLISME